MRAHSVHFAIAAAAVLTGLPAQAESLRCSGGLAAEGDSRLSVAYKCGQPILTDSHCAPVYYRATWQPVPEPYASVVVPCQQVDEPIFLSYPLGKAANPRFGLGAQANICATM